MHSQPLTFYAFIVLKITDSRAAVKSLVCRGKASCRSGQQHLQVFEVQAQECRDLSVWLSCGPGPISFAICDVYVFGVGISWKGE